MLIQQVFAPATAPDTISSEIGAIVDRLRPAVVQVSSGRRGQGAGVIWQRDGIIMTNHHVIAYAGPHLEVQLQDGRRLAAHPLASNPTLDLALLEVEASDLPAATVGDSQSLRIGELVFAIGHPWGQRDVLTAGIISGLGTVEVAGGRWQAQYLRSDVRLAPGNSGGPLLNAGGEVVGINAMIFGGDLAVAIPSHVARHWAGDLPRRGVFLGVGARPVELPAVARQGNRANQQHGLLLVQIALHSPASQAGLLLGDVLLDIGGVVLNDGNCLVAALDQYSVGERIQLNLLRNGRIIERDAVLAARVRR
jgi:serine protease Do